MKKSSTAYNPGIRLGILGGGQLARFISLKAQEMGVKVRLLCASPDEPAAQVTQDVVIGDLKDNFIRYQFLDGLNALTFESEFVDASPLLEGASSLTIAPSIELMNTLRDRFTQKETLKKYGITAAGEIRFESRADLKEFFAAGKKPFVLKKRLFGYDGYGTVVVKTAGDLDGLPTDFSAAGWIAEEFCPFKRELAFSLARNAENDFYVLPLVETRQTESKCDWVKGPIKHRQLEPLIKRFKKLMTAEKYVGLLSVELFETSKGLIVNELAPRVHNSAHYSIEALEVSQFEAHLRCVLGWALPKKPALLRKGFAMANLIGTQEKTALVRLDQQPGGFTHWYGKTLTKPGRKMGHLTVLGSNAEKSLNQALKWRKSFWL